MENPVVCANGQRLLKDTTCSLVAYNDNAAQIYRCTEMRSW